MATVYRPGPVGYQPLVHGPVLASNNVNPRVSQTVLRPLARKCLALFRNSNGCLFLNWPQPLNTIKFAIQTGACEKPQLLSPDAIPALLQGRVCFPVMFKRIDTFHIRTHIISTLTCLLPRIRSHHGLRAMSVFCFVFRLTRRPSGTRSTAARSVGLIHLRVTSKRGLPA